MMKVKKYVCPECGRIYKTLGGWSTHMEKEHPDSIPENMSLSQYFYYLQTGKDHGTCVNCGAPTSWNESSMKYNRLCGRPECNASFRKKFEKNCINKLGYVHRLDDPEVQKMMQSKRKIAGKFTFTNGDAEPVQYLGKDELAFLQMLDALGWDGKDVMGPSPFPYEYMYVNPNDKEHEGKKYYMPDFYIPSLNLEVEIKDTSNNHHKIVAIDRVKDECKRKAMEANTMVNFLFIDQKNYQPFFEFLFEAKATILDYEIKDGKIGSKSRLVQQAFEGAFASSLVSEYSAVMESSMDEIEEVPEDYFYEENITQDEVSAMLEAVDQGYDGDNREVRTDSRFAVSAPQPSTRPKRRDRLVRLYHGSDMEFEYLLARGMDFGNAFQKPGWSLFVSKDRDFTFKWALFRAIRIARKDNKRFAANMMWNPKAKTFNITEKSFEVMKDLFEDGSIKAYLYTIDVPAHMVGLGNDSSLDERTIRTQEKINYTLKEEFIVTEEMARKYGRVVDDETFKREERIYRNKPMLFNRGISALAMTKDYSYQNKANQKALKVIFNGLNTGELTPGDDLEAWLKARGHKIKSIGILKRLLIQAGIEGYTLTEDNFMEDQDLYDTLEFFPEDAEECFLLVCEYDPENTIDIF